MPFWNWSVTCINYIKFQKGLLTGTPSPSQATARVCSISALLHNVIFELSDHPLCWPWSCSSIIFLGIILWTAVNVYLKSWHVQKGSQGTASPVHFRNALLLIPVPGKSPNAGSTSGIILSWSILLWGWCTILIKDDGSPGSVACDLSRVFACSRDVNPEWLDQGLKGSGCSKSTTWKLIFVSNIQA